MNWNYAAGILLLIVLVTRIALWVKFRHRDLGRRIGIGTLQLLLVGAAAVLLEWRPNATMRVFLGALAGIVILSCVPTKRTK